MALTKYEYLNTAEKDALLIAHSAEFLLEESREIVDKQGTVKTYLTFDNTDPEPEITGFKGLNLATLTPAKVDAYIDNNVANLNEAKIVLKQLAKAVLWIAKKHRMM